MKKQRIFPAFLFAIILAALAAIVIFSPGGNALAQKTICTDQQGTPIPCTPTFTKFVPPTDTPSATKFVPPTNTPVKVNPPTDTPVQVQKPTVTATGTPTSTPSATVTATASPTIRPSFTPPPFPTVALLSNPLQFPPLVLTPQPTFRPPLYIRTPPPAGDVRVCGMEITQAIQKYPSSGPGDLIPLIGFKPTIVRVYIASTGGPWNNVTARLRVRNADNSGPFRIADHYLTPSNPRGVITAPAACSDRTSLTDSFYFVLGWEDTMPTLASGRIFEVTVDSSRSGLTETNYTNNTYSQTVPFGPGFRVTIYGVTYSNFNPTLAAAPWSDFEAQRRYVESLLPVVFYGYNIVPLPGNPQPTFDDAGGGMAYQTARDWAYNMELRMNTAELAAAAAGEGIPGYQPQPIYMLQPEGSCECGAAVNYGTALNIVVINGQDVTSDPGRVMAQEVAHWIGLWWHAVSPTLPAGMPNPDFPFADASIGPQVGVSLEDPANVQLLSGSGVHDIMSYATVNKWVSPYTYCDLIDDITRGALACPASVRRAYQGGETAGLFPVGLPAGLHARTDASAAAPRKLLQAAANFLIVAGRINPDGSASFLPFQTLASQTDLTSRMPGSAYRLALESNSGQVLQEASFDPAASMHPEAGEAQYFSLILPFDASTARISLYKGSQVLAQRTVSAHAPQVTLLAPKAGDKLSGVQTVSWQASDADNDPLTFSLEYSSNGGGAWFPINTGLTGSSAQVDFGQFPGSDQTMLRVVASDGVNATAAASGAFSVSAKAPQITLVSPAEGTTFYKGQPFTAEATAFDWQDGPMTDPSQYAWSSDRDGSLGSGLWTQLSSLTPGKHTLTVTARDSGGRTATASVHITILDQDWIAGGPAGQTGGFSSPAWLTPALIALAVVIVLAAVWLLLAARRR